MSTIKNGKEQRSAALVNSPVFQYLPETDRYLQARSTPRYRFNVIGAGIMGQEHINVTHLEGRASVHGVYDPNPGSVRSAQQAKARWSDEPLIVYDSVEAACSDPAADALIIATPNYTHLDVLKLAAQSGKPIMLEKPISTNVRDAAEIVRIAESYDALLQVGLQYRYKPMIVEAIYEALERKTLGNLKLISMSEHRIPFLDKVGQWNKFAQYSGNTLIEKCCHYFDLLNLFAQARPLSIFASGSQAVNFADFEYNEARSDILDNALVVIDYDNGIRANFNLCMFAPMFYEELTLCGDSGRLRAWEQSDTIPGAPAHNNVEVMCGQDRPSRRIQAGYPAHIEDSGHSGATYYEHLYFVDNLDGQQTTTATAREGLWSVIVASAAQESIQRGTVVNINDYLAELGVEA